MREKQPHIIWIVEELPPEMQKLIHWRRKVWKQFHDLLPTHSHTTVFFKKKKKSSKITNF